MNADTLYYLAARPREAVADGRAWLVDCFADDTEQIELLNAVGIVAGVQRHYEGGYRQFLVDGFNLRAA